MTDKLKFIEIFCEDHGRISKVESNARIVCQITGHYLAFGFPYDRIWEYCCDCEVFQASKLAKSKAALECRICRREIARRYMCYNCQTVSFESHQPPRGKHLAVLESVGLLQCTGCSSEAQRENIILHHCTSLGIDLMTARLDCLFCRRQTNEKIDSNANGFGATVSRHSDLGEIISIECPNTRCRNIIPTDSLFCPCCGLKLKRCAIKECGMFMHPASRSCPHCGTVCLVEQA